MVKILGYIGFGATCLLFSLYLTFPAEVMGRRIVHEVRKQTKGKVNLSFEEIDISGPNGIEAQGVGIKVGKQDPIRLDSLHTHIPIFSLITFNPAIDAEIGLGDGSIEIEATPDGAGMELELEIDELNLDRPALLGKYAGLPIRGIVTGEVETGWKKGLKTMKGAGKLQLKKLSVGPGRIAGVSFPVISLGDIEMELEADKGILKVGSYKQSGGDFQTRISGEVELRSRVSSIMFRNFCIQFKGDPTFLNKNDKLKSALELAAIQLKKASDDFFHVPLTGPATRPRLSRGLCSSERSGNVKRPRRR